MEHTLARIAYNAANAELRGQTVVITGHRGATHWDNARLIVRTIERDGSLGQEWLVTPSIVLR